jgi:hypothetical protein
MTSKPLANDLITDTSIKSNRINSHDEDVSQQQRAYKHQLQGANPGQQEFVRTEAWGMIGSLRRLVDHHIPEANFWKRKPPAIPALDLGVLRNNNAMTKISGSKKAPQADRFIDWMRRVTRDIQRTPRSTRATYQQGEEVDPNSGWEKEMGGGEAPRELVR